MIDENELIEAFEKNNLFLPEAVEKLILSQPKVGEWIPCSERLPEDPGFYVVTKRQKSGEIKVTLGSFHPLFNEWSGNGNFKDVLAWMPLPEPFKKEEPEKEPEWKESMMKKFLRGH